MESVEQITLFSVALLTNIWILPFALHTFFNIAFLAFGGRVQNVMIVAVAYNAVSRVFAFVAALQNARIALKRNWIDVELIVDTIFAFYTIRASLA